MAIGRACTLLALVAWFAMAACYPSPQMVATTTVRYRIPGQPAPTGDAKAYLTDAEGRVVAIADGVVVRVGETDPERIGVSVVVDHSTVVGKWADYDYLAEVRVRPGDKVRRGETLGWVVRPGHVRGYDGKLKAWLARVSLSVCDGPCAVASGDPTPNLRICMRKARPGDVIFPVVC